MTTDQTPSRYQVIDYKSVVDGKIEQRFAHIRDGIADHTITVTSEIDARDLIAKLSAWLDAPRLAARKTPTVVASHGAVDLVRTASGEWGVRWRLEDVDDGATDTAWHLTEADARADFRDDTGTVSCESCARFIEHDDAHVDADGIYTCADETACSAAIRAKESAK